MQRLVQLTLDLFDAPTTAPAPRPPPVSLVPAVPAVPIAQELAPVQFQHPRATRQAQLPGAVVGYEFKRAKRRTIGFVVGPDGLVVSAPRWVPLAEVDAAVREKGGWIVKKLGQARERQQRMATARIEWKDGAELPYLGGTLRLALEPAQRGGAAVLQAEAGLLQLALPHSASPDQIRDAVQAWLMRQARSLFIERLQHYAPQVGVQWTRLRLSSAGTRWGSASADGSIRLNWRLIHFRLPVIDYVVVHELSHLRVMDHSPRFWDTVATVVPDYAQLRGQLKDELIPQWQ
ncbi:M48 family metallopeptidase [Pseudorhodoferax sp. Leaf267]|uniref:M48 family metallopeptidase n=1 Tax=Pseudorhodoferax sp. Leaf267 TaxID=1736316 RepID=UPI0006F9EACC|nr:SprT family zinc-dependent metalloprotease [Pseudorhodoferax sp. Leaf267]KQP14419.1 metal-dependent hydrolase [Pseudorhodoferax sp. Leaf267]